MPAIFPTIYPEEPLLSAISRYADIMGFPDENAVTLSLFGRYRVALTAQLMAGLGELIRSLPPGHRYTFMGLAERHTAYPYMRPFLPADGARALRRHLAHIPQPDYTRKRKPPPRRTAVVHDPEYLRFCGACVKEDCAGAWGEPYWRRVHQVAGVLVCPVHGVILHQSEAPSEWPWHVLVPDRWTPARPTRPLSLTRALEWPHHAVACPEGHDVALRAVADATLWLHQHRIETADLTDLAARYRARLADLGFLGRNRRIRQPALLAKFLRVFPDDLLTALGCYGAADPGTPDRQQWVSAFLAEPRVAHPPLLHILILHFLGLTPEEFFASPVPVSPAPLARLHVPGPCANPVCPRYEPPVPREIAVPADATRVAAFATVECAECGFTYSQRVGPEPGGMTVLHTGNLWAARLRELSATRGVGLADAAEALGVGIARVRSDARVLGVWNRAWGPRPQGPRLSAPERRRAARLRFHRERWTRLLYRYDRAELRYLRATLPVTYNYLRRTDREWLDRHLPRAPPTPHTWVNWGYCDIQTSHKVGAIVDALRAWPGEPVRVTVAEVARHLPPWSKLVQRYRRYPDTRAVLDPLLDTVDGFAERRIVWAAKWLEGRGHVPTARELAVHARLSARQNRDLQAALERAVEALRARADGGDLPREWETRLPANFEVEYGAMFQQWWGGPVDKPRNFRYFFGSPADPFPGGYDARRTRRAGRRRAAP